MNGSESRQAVEESFIDVFVDVNKLIDDGFVEVGADIYLGGDYKVS